ncbi:MAG: ribosome silencing factor [Rhizobiales bacterium]|nr:ribosome silencing factor [Hyphomicrobiales bacterium]
MAAVPSHANVIGGLPVSVTAAYEAAIASLEDAKAEDIVTINISEKSSIGDAMIIASGRSHRHVGAIADRLMRDLKTAGYGMPAVEGLPHCDWVLVDTGDIIVHIFRPEVREFYSIEKMWSADLTPDTVIARA